MKNGKRKIVVTLIITTALIFTLFSIGSMASAMGTERTITQSPETFRDISGHWGEAYIKEAAEAGIVTGYKNGTFKPNNNITRAEFVAMVNKTLQLRDENIVNLTFLDVDETDWYYRDIQKASFARYVNGVSITKFMPETCITREEAATMLARLLPKSGYQSEVSLKIYPDTVEISDWAKASIAVTVNKGYVKGFTNGNLAPLAKLTRAEAVKIICSMKDNETIVRENISLASSGDILKDAIYVGDITIEKSVGEGEAVLQNLSALSKVYIFGGGANTVTLRNSTIIQLIVGKEGTKVRVLSDDGNIIYNTYVFNNNYIVNSDGQDVNTGGDSYRNIIRMSGSFSEEDAIRIARGISNRLDNTGEVTKEQVKAGVLAVIPDAITTFDENGDIINALIKNKNEIKKRNYRSHTASPTVDVTGITVVPKVKIINPSTITISAILSPANATNKNLIWISSNESVATVTANGEVTIKTHGTSTITAITVDGGYAATTVVTGVTVAEAHVYWTYEQTFNSYTESADLTIEEKLIDAELKFFDPNGRFVRMANSLPSVPGKNIFLESTELYKIKVLNARAAFNETQLAEPKELIAGAAYIMTQSAATDELAVKSAIESIISGLSISKDVLTTVNKVAYTPAVAGDAGNPNGTDGIYIFTVGLVKGSATGTTETLTMTITATPFEI